MEVVDTMTITAVEAEGVVGVGTKEAATGVATKEVEEEVVVATGATREEDTMTTMAVSPFRDASHSCSPCSVLL